MNSELGKNVQNDFEKYFFELLNNTVFGKAMENVREQRYQVCKNRSKKELFSVTTKLPDSKIFWYDYVKPK